jgi:hypothetical protein
MLLHSLNSVGFRLLIKRCAVVLLGVVTAGVAAGVVTCSAQEPGERQSSVTMVAPANSITSLLPPTLAGLRSNGGIEQFQLPSLGDLTGERATIFLEYGVDAAAARDYGEYRVQVFQTPTPIQAFGLFTYNSPQPVDFRRVKESPVATARTPDGEILWKGNFFVRIKAARTRPASFRTADQVSSEIAGLIGIAAPGQLPSLPDSLPNNSSGGEKVRYFLGTRSLGSFVDHAAEMFGFEGRAEAALAPYEQASNNPGAKPVNLLIVEYNTPQFAHDALVRAIGFANALPEDEQKRIIIRREGNYIVEATGVANSIESHDVARRLVDSVKYPYTVKWLKDPHSRSYDRFAGQKAAQIILSSFGIVGVLLLAAFVGGAILGTTAFIRRRRRQIEVFSDAGGMLCLDIDRLCTGTPARMELASGGVTDSGVS